MNESSNTPDLNELEETSWHGATEEEGCYKMRDKYGWELIDIERFPDRDSILRYKCIFKGYTEFPSYLAEKD